MINKKPVQHALNGLMNIASPLAALVSDKSSYPGARKQIQIGASFILS